MKRLGVVALVAVLLGAWGAGPARAQRGASHGGGGGHAVPSFRGGPGTAFRGGAGSSRLLGSSGLALYSPRGSVFARGGYSAATSGLEHNAYADRADERVNQRKPYRRPYRGEDRFGARGPYIYPVLPGGYDAYFLGYPYLPDVAGYGDYDDSSAAYESLSQDYGPEPVAQEPPALPAWPSSAPPQPAAAPEMADAVTIVFKDGRPAEQIHNYMLTSTTLFVLDRHRQEIPIGELDLPATEKANRDAGVEFKLPGVEEMTRPKKPAPASPKPSSNS